MKSYESYCTIFPKQDVMNVIYAALKTNKYTGNIKNYYYLKRPNERLQNSTDKEIIEILDQMELQASKHNIKTDGQLVPKIEIKASNPIDIYLVALVDFIRDCGFVFFRVIRDSYDLKKPSPWYVEFSNSFLPWAPYSEDMMPEDFYTELMKLVTKSPISTKPTGFPNEPQEELKAYPANYDKFMPTKNTFVWKAQEETYTMTQSAIEQLIASAPLATKLSEVNFTLKVSKPEYRWNAANYMKNLLIFAGFKSPGAYFSSADPLEFTITIF